MVSLALTFDGFGLSLLISVDLGIPFLLLGLGLFSSFLAIVEPDGRAPLLPESIHSLLLLIGLGLQELVDEISLVLLDIQFLLNSPLIDKHFSVPAFALFARKFVVLLSLFDLGHSGRV